jgi:hypothetical protein
MSEIDGYGIHRAYGIWRGMIDRCTNPKHKAFKDYGGRGIRVCDRWQASFDDFLADMGIPPQKHSLDRINVNGDYSPDNCRWATAKVQANNTRKQLPDYHPPSPLYTWMNEQGMSITDLAERLEMSPCTVWRFVSGDRKVSVNFRLKFGNTFGFDLVFSLFEPLKKWTPKAQP